MKQLWAVILLLLLVPLGRTALGQLAPLQIQVVKTTQPAGAPNARHSGYDDSVTRVTDNILTFYTIQLSRAMMPLKGVWVRWAILVQQRSPQRLRVIDGERTCDVPIGKTVSLKTQSIRTGVMVHTSTYGDYGFGGSDSVTSHPRDQIKGYEVEVYVQGQRVIADIQPPEVQQEIEARRTRRRNAEANRSTP